jgi:tripartite-type tricarboxylate transporter receptor subunit TctC
MLRLQSQCARFFCLSFVLLLPISGNSAEQTYPSRPVTLIIGFGPGGEVHRTADAMAQWLSRRLGQPVVIENRVGDVTNIATEAVVRAPADGYTFLVANTANAINATVYENLTFNSVRDITPVAGLVRIPLIVIVAPSFLATTVPELVSYAKANPGKVTMAAPSMTLSLAASAFTMMSGVQVTRVSYSGDVAAVKDLLAGKVQVQFAGLGAAQEHVTSGKLRALAVSSSVRVRSLPDVPTIGEFIPGYELTAWLGIAAPKNTPTDTIERMSKEVAAGLADPEVQSRLAAGHVPMPMTAAEFGKFMASETDRLGKLAKLTGVKAQAPADKAAGK